MALLKASLSLSLIAELSCSLSTYGDLEADKVKEMFNRRRKHELISHRKSQVKFEKSVYSIFCLRLFKLKLL